MPLYRSACSWNVQVSIKILNVRDKVSDCKLVKMQREGFQCACQDMAQSADEGHDAIVSCRVKRCQPSHLARDKLLPNHLC
jgi:hypothetical protein